MRTDDVQLIALVLCLAMAAIVIAVRMAFRPRLPKTGDVDWPLLQKWVEDRELYFCIGGEWGRLRSIKLFPIDGQRKLMVRYTDTAGTPRIYSAPLSRLHTPYASRDEAIYIGVKEGPTLVICRKDPRRLEERARSSLGRKTGPGTLRSM